MKNTEANVVAIKQEIIRLQRELKSILDRIETAKSEEKLLRSVLQEKRSIVENFVANMSSVFTRENNKISALLKKKEALEIEVSKLEITTGLLKQNIILQKEEVSSPKSVVFVESVTATLRTTLDSLLSKIHASKDEVKELERQKLQFEKANKALSKDKLSQEQKVKIAKQKLIDIDKAREKQLREFSKENKKLTQIRNRERDSKAMEQRLSSEYIKVYESLPRRGKK